MCVINFSMNFHNASAQDYMLNTIMISLIPIYRRYMIYRISIDKMYVFTIYRIFCIKIWFI